MKPHRFAYRAAGRIPSWAPHIWSSFLDSPRVDHSGLVLHSDLRAHIGRKLGPYSPMKRWYRRLRPRWVWERMNPVGRATHRFVAEHGLTVRRGPFSGVRYHPGAVGRASFLPSKLLGCYERELAPILAEAWDFDLFVDVGAGDGYYCVGVKRLFPATRVIGYEIGRVERSTAAKLAALNGVRFESRARADHAALNALISGRLLLMVDVEGYEYELLNPALVPRLLDATMIVEAHPAVHPAVVETLRSRFSQSHDVTVIQGSGRDIREFPELANWNEAQARFAISEGRTLNPLWLVLRPRASG